MGNMKNKMAALTNLTHLLSHVFSSHFVFPVLGHDDPEPLPDAEEPYKDLAELWKQWLPSEALVTFRKGKLGPSFYFPSFYVHTCSVYTWEQKLWKCFHQLRSDNLTLRKD